MNDGLDPEDVEAQRQRDESRQIARNHISQHLSEHLMQNPNATYTSWIATLHPENVTVDPRLLNEGNAWLQVWEEASGGGRRHLCRCCETIFHKPTNGHTNGRLPVGWGGLIDTTVGVALTIVAILSVVLLEACRSVLLWLAWLCGRAVKRLPHSWPQLDAPLAALRSVPAVLVMLVMLAIVIVAGLVRILEQAIAEFLAYTAAVLCGVLSLSPNQGSWTRDKVRKVVGATEGALSRLRPPHHHAEGTEENTAPEVEVAGGGASGDVSGGGGANGRGDGSGGGDDGGAQGG